MPLVIETGVLVSAGAGWALLVIIGLIRLWITRQMASKALCGVVIPTYCGKSDFVKNYKDTYTESSNILFIDIEEQIKNSSDLTSDQKTELDALKSLDSYLYESKLIEYSKKVFIPLYTNLRKTNKDKKIVVLASSKHILKALNIKTYWSFIPNQKLYKTISDAVETAEASSLNYLKYSMGKIDVNAKTTTSFSDFDTLFEEVLKKLKVKK